MNLQTGLGASGSRAIQACISCRKGKRKCDKSFPSCGLCARMGKDCDYNDVPLPAPTAEDLFLLQQRLAELENRLTTTTAAAATVVAGAINGAGTGTGGGTGMTGLGAGMGAGIGMASEAAGVPGNVNSRGPLWLPPSLDKFPSAIFLDIDCFKWAQLPIPKPNVHVPPEVYEILSRGNAVHGATGEYFSTVHTWFPIISQKRMTIGTALWEGGPDLAMLFLAMLLVTTKEMADMQDALANPLYAASKRFLALLEGSGCLSLMHLQAMILVALYELGHGIYPAAWMTVGQCARYVEMIGIPSFKESSILLGSCSTWTEVEERRRVWWAVYILDRAICLGNKRRFALSEPDDSFVLPTDDSAWDDGDPSRGMVSPLNVPLFQPQGAFARLVQAAMLASNIITHCRTNIQNYRNNTPEPFDLARVTGLADTLAAFSRTVREQLPKAPPDDYFPGATPAATICSTTTTTTTTTANLSNTNTLSTLEANSESTPTSSLSVSSNDSLPDFGVNGTSGPQQQQTCSKIYFSLLPSRCLALSALILLLDAYACPENLRDGPGPGGMDAAPKTADELTMQLRAVSGLRETSLLIRDLGLELLEAAMLPQAQERVSCLCLDALYGAVATLHWLYKEAGDDETHAALCDVARCLARVGMRWKLADEYLGMVHHHNVTTAMALKGVTP